MTRFGQNNRVKIPSNISLSLSYEHYQQINRQVDQQHANSDIVWTTCTQITTL